jgi:hypothetical protein
MGRPLRGSELLLLLFFSLLCCIHGLLTPPVRLEGTARLFQRVEEKTETLDALGELDLDMDDEIKQKRQRIREERQLRAESAPLAFGFNETKVWTLADTFGVNSTLVKVIFTAIDEATQILTKAEVGFASFARVLQSKIEMDLKTTQRFADFVARKAVRGSSQIVDDLDNLNPLEDMVNSSVWPGAGAGAGATSSSVTGLALLRVGMNPLAPSAGKARLLPSMAASPTTMGRARAVRLKRRSAPPALLGASQAQYRSIKTLPNKLKYDFGRKKVKSASSTGSDTLNTIFKALPGIALSNVNACAAAADGPRVLELGPGVSAGVNVGLDTMVQGVPTPAKAVVRERSSVAEKGKGAGAGAGAGVGTRAALAARKVPIDPSLALLQDYELLARASVELKFALDNCGQAMHVLKQEGWDGMGAESTVDARAGAGVDAPVCIIVNDLQEMCSCIEAARGAAARLARVARDGMPLWRADSGGLVAKETTTSVFDGVVKRLDVGRRVSGGGEGGEGVTVEVQSTQMQEQITAMASLTEGMLAILADVDKGSYSGWVKSVETASRLGEQSTKVFAAVQQMLQPGLVWLTKSSSSWEIESAVCYDENDKIDGELDIDILVEAEAAAYAARFLVCDESAVGSSVSVSVSVSANETPPGVQFPEHEHEHEHRHEGAYDAVVVSSVGSEQMKDAQWVGSSADGFDIRVPAAALPLSGVGKSDVDIGVCGATDRAIGHVYNEVDCDRSGDGDRARRGMTTPGGSSAATGEATVTVETEAIEQDTAEQSAARFLVTAFDVSLFLLESLLKTAGPLLLDGGRLAAARVESTLEAAPRAKASSARQAWRLLPKLTNDS